MIAEAGFNPRSLDEGFEYVDRSKEAGAWGVKFQYADLRYFSLGSEIPKKLREQALSLDDLKRLAHHAAKVGIKFIVTPHDFTDTTIKFVADFCDYVKIASPDIDNVYLFHKLSKHAPINVIASTGMAATIEISTMIHTLSQMIGWPEAELVVMHCTSEYPAPISSLYLNVIKQLRYALPENYSAGYSDHTAPDVVWSGALATALGARYIERHVKLRPSDVVLDEPVSMPMDTFAEYVSMAKTKRVGEKGIPHVGHAVRSGSKPVTDKERDLRVLTRRVLMATRKIKVGEKVSMDNVIPVRPGNLADSPLLKHLVPIHRWSMVKGNTVLAELQPYAPIFDYNLER